MQAAPPGAPHLASGSEVWAVSAALGSEINKRSTPLTPLETGAQVRIGGRTFRIKTALGEGSFGAVWAAEDDFCGEVAVKEIQCRSEAELLRAASERQFLQFLGRELFFGDRGDQEVKRRVPALIASEVEAIGPEIWQVRLAMTRVMGTPLEHVLEHEERRRQGRQHSLPPRWGFADACRYVWVLLSQLAPALEHISSKAFHRDITPRNILVDESAGAPSFGIVDFGLAVDTERWQTDASASDIGGDGHYWPASAWLVFGHGSQALEEHPALEQEYQLFLDLHAMGITALRSLMELAPDYEQPDSTVGSSSRQALRVLHIAWNRYWGDVTRFWQPVYDAFRRCSADGFESLKADYAARGVHHIVSADLCALRGALHQLRQACEFARPEDGLAGFQGLFEAFILMIRPGKSRADAPTWRNVRIMLDTLPLAGDGSPTGAKSRSRTGGRHSGLTPTRSVPAAGGHAPQLGGSKARLDPSSTRAAVATTAAAAAAAAATIAGAAPPSTSGRSPGPSVRLQTAY